MGGMLMSKISGLTEDLKTPAAPAADTAAPAAGAESASGSDDASQPTE